MSGPYLDFGPRSADLQVDAAVVGHDRREGSVKTHLISASLYRGMVWGMLVNNNNDYSDVGLTMLVAEQVGLV